MTRRKDCRARPWPRTLSFALGALALAAAACLAGGPPPLPPEVAAPGRPASSPSGRYALFVVVHNTGGAEEQSFEIRDQTDTVVYASPDRFRTRDTTYFLWGLDDRVWVYSGDLGTFFWESQGDAAWTKFAYAEAGVPAPPFLKQVRPSQHPK